MSWDRLETMLDVGCYAEHSPGILETINVINLIWLPSNSKDRIKFFYICFRVTYFAAIYPSPDHVSIVSYSHWLMVSTSPAAPPTGQWTGRHQGGGLMDGMRILYPIPGLVVIIICSPFGGQNKYHFTHWHWKLYFDFSNVTLGTVASVAIMTKPTPAPGTREGSIGVSSNGILYQNIENMSHYICNNQQF